MERILISHLRDNVTKNFLLLSNHKDFATREDEGDYPESPIYALDYVNVKYAKFSIIKYVTSDKTYIKFYNINNQSIRFVIDRKNAHTSFIIMDENIQNKKMVKTNFNYGEDTCYLRQFGELPFFIYYNLKDGSIRFVSRKSQYDYTDSHLRKSEYTYSNENGIERYYFILDHIEPLVKIVDSQIVIEFYETGIIEHGRVNRTFHKGIVGEINDFLTSNGFHYLKINVEYLENKISKFELLVHDKRFSVYYQNDKDNLIIQNYGDQGILNGYYYNNGEQGFYLDGKRVGYWKVEGKIKNYNENDRLFTLFPIFIL